MNYSIGIFAVLFMAITNLEQSAISFSSAQEPEKIVVELQLDSEEQGKFKLGKDMISINPIRGNYTVKIGKQLVYSASVHGSVGYTASAYSSDRVALPLSRSFIEFDDDERAEMSGGDSGTKYFIFDASKVGTYEVIAKKYFRGDLENEYTITINVTE